jgi:tetratricopeptide (TPR) repeat protein
MFNAEKTVFISYRRSVSKFIARCVFQDLHYNGYDVFLDVENINNGTFENIILNQIAARAHFLVILTPGTLERCAEPGDWLRREIEFAMDLKRNIIPVMVDDFDFNASLPFLTGKLVHLQSYNGLRLRYEFFDDSMRKLRNHFLKQPVYSEIFPAPPEDRAAVQEIINKATDEPFPTQNEVQAESFLMRGLQKWAAGDLDGAIADYDEAIRLNPHDCDAYSNRAVVRQSRGDLAGALADYDRAIKHTPKEGLAFVYINRGMVRADLGDVEGAIADYSSAIQHNSESASAYYIRGNARFNKGDRTARLWTMTGS